MSNAELKDEEIDTEEKFENHDDNSQEDLVDPRVQVSLSALPHLSSVKNRRRKNQYCLNNF